MHNPRASYRPGAILRACLLSFAVLIAAAPMPDGALAAMPPLLDGAPLPSLAPMLDRVVPAVVNISSKTHVRVNNPLLNDPVLRQFFGLQNAPRERIEQSLGSGVIIDAANGYVLTNNHVIQGADDISVTLYDGRTLKAKLRGSDPDTDVAVIEIPADGLAALPLADSSKLRVGDFVVAIGEPFGLGQTVTSGIVSALNRTGLGGLNYQNFIQTDASINPGNSGGALVNLRGELVGVNSAIYTPSGGNVGIGFAIPSNLAADVMRQLIATGGVRHGSIGVEVQTVDAPIAREFALREGQQGAIVTQVRPGSPAAAAGLQQGDVIVAVNDRAILTQNDLYNAEGIATLGSSLALKLLRDGKVVTLNAHLAVEQVATSQGAGFDARLAGAELADPSERVRRTGLRGVSVMRVGSDSRAAANGLKAGDLIIGINAARIGSLAELKPLAGNPPRRLQLTIVRDGAQGVLNAQ
ncbi:MAG: Do family serine endopeptidase [Rudaea sp.]